MNYDKAIKKALDEIKKSGKKSITFEAIQIKTGLSNTIINRRLKSFSKFGIIRPLGYRHVKYYIFNKKKKEVF